jgi:hypothetical protein
MRHTLIAAIAFSLGVGASRLFWVGAIEAQSMQPIEIGGQDIHLGVTRDEILAKYSVTTTDKTEKGDTILIWSGSDPDYHKLGSAFFRRGADRASYIIKDWRSTFNRGAEPLWEGFYGAVASATRMRKAPGMIYVDNGTKPDFSYERITIEFPGHSVELLRMNSYGLYSSISYSTSEDFADSIGSEIRAPK